LIPCLFLFFTWRGLLVYFSFDDLMNLYGSWRTPAALFIKSIFLFWTPSYRPLVGLIYHAIYEIFGLNPRPLYTVHFAAMLGNLWLGYLLFRRLSGSRETAAIATLLFAYHGKLASLYYSAGSLYDVLCFSFLAVALLIYLRARSQNRLPEIWETCGFLACFLCALDSKEVAATVPAIVLLYELLFHPPRRRSLRSLIRWCVCEARMAFLSAFLVLLYIPAKLHGFASDVDYVPSYTWSRWLNDTGAYLGYLLYRNNPSVRFGVNPFTPLGIALFFGISIAVALWARSRVVWFGLLFFTTTLLPVSFIPLRLGFVLYIPLAGLALSAAACLVRLKEALYGYAPHFRAPAASTALFAATALLITATDYHFWTRAPRDWYSPYKKTIGSLSQLYPTLPHGSKMLFVHSGLDSDFSMVFLLRLYYRDPDLFVTLLNGPHEQRIALEQLPRYDHVLDFENSHYVELDNTDALLSIQLHLLKSQAQSGSPGELMTAGSPGAAQHIVKGVLAADPKADGYWTLDQSELRFQLSSREHRYFRTHFTIPRDVFQQTGPLLVDFYINGRLLDRARFAQDGDVVYQHEVPPDWLRTDGVTTVQIRVHNPYVSPRDGARLAFVLKSAAFTPAPRDR
jgi:hypothetical protein